MVFFNGKVALITGGASGIGLATVHKFLENGIKGIGVVDISDENLRKVEKQLCSKYPNKIIFIKADVSNGQQLEDAFKKTVNTFRNIDIVFNNAGIMEQEDWERIIAVNLVGIIWGTYLARDKYFPKYKSGDEGLIINTGSIAGLVGIRETTAYSAAKHGVVGLGKSIEAQRGSDKIRVITICPGVVKTPLSDGVVLPMSVENYGISTMYMSPEFIGESVIKLLQKAKHGSVWLIENEEPPVEVNFPTPSEIKAQSNNSL